MSDPDDLDWLLGALDARRRPGRFVFASVADAATAAPLSDGSVVAMVREEEGTTLVLEEAAAQALGLVGGPPFAMLSLGVHSPVDSVGLTAALATVLATRGIACNVVAGAYHDHLFVPVERADEALAVLSGIGGAAREP